MSQSASCYWLNAHSDDEKNVYKTKTEHTVYVNSVG